MPKRVIDFEAMWASDKLARCAAWAQAEYAWLYGLADASGSFELTNLRVIWGRVAAIRENLSLERLEQVFAEFCDKGLLFVWEENGKRYGHWTNCEKPGRLPRTSRRSTRYEKVFAPPVPDEAYRAYRAQFHAGSAGLTTSGSASPGELTTRGATPGASRADERPSLATATATDEEKKLTEEDVAPHSAEASGVQKMCPAEASALAYRGARLSITARQDSLLSAAFPWVERQAEYHKMNSWLEADPLRRPRNASRFAHNWFSRIPPPRDAASEPAKAMARPEVRAGAGPSLSSGRVKAEYLELLRQREDAERRR